MRCTVSKKSSGKSAKHARIKYVKNFACLAPLRGAKYVFGFGSMGFGLRQLEVHAK